MSEPAHLYFHSPCFDGISSCVLAWDFLEASRGWRIGELHSVNYDVRENWLSTALCGPAAVVDFLYHPQAEFWADHHLTTFLTDEAKDDFERRRNGLLTYDRQSSSCALLLWNHFLERFGYQNLRYKAMVDWADKIDSARYDSVDDAILGDAPALQIRSSLASKDGKKFSEELVRALRRDELDEVAQSPDVVRRASETEAMIQAGLDRFEASSTLEADEIVTFDVDSSDVMVSRYAPYHFYHDARYSVGVVRSTDGAAVTAMRNPWRDFPSLSLGKILEKFGGGGHQRVASVFLSGERASEAGSIRDQVLEEIRREDTAQTDSSAS